MFYNCYLEQFRIIIENKNKIKQLAEMLREGNEQFPQKWKSRMVDNTQRSNSAPPFIPVHFQQASMVLVLFNF